MLLTPVVAKLVHGAVPQFARFEVSTDTYIQQAIAVVLVGFLAALVPMVKSARVKIVDGLRHVG
jgi:putative ABC transport system permease protein